MEAKGLEMDSTKTTYACTPSVKYSYTLRACASQSADYWI